MKKYIGNRAFYKKLFNIMLPILIQNLITNFVSLLDNIMVGRLGTEPMSGVAIVNQILFVFNICVFGGLAGAGIFTAQYFGKGDGEGVKKTFRAKLWIGTIIFTIAFSVITLFGDFLISLFIHEGEENLNLQATFDYALDYLSIIRWQMPLFALMNVYSSTLCEIGRTRLPLQANIAAVLTNLIGNYILIYGNFGAPRLGVEGAAIATVIARVVELGIVSLYPHTHRAQYSFTKELYSTLHVPGKLVWKIARKGFPLLMNELLWAGGLVTLNQIMSLRGLETISAENIASTVSNLFFCSFTATGTAISIIIGQLLGAGETDRAIDENRKLMAFTIALSTVAGIVMLVAAPYIPLIYNTTPTVRSLAAKMIMVNAVMMPSNAYTNASFFTLRSGGRVWITFLYDSVYIWVLSIPVTLVLVKFTAMSVLFIYAVSYGIDIIKCIAGYILVNKQIWVNNLVSEDIGD